MIAVIDYDAGNLRSVETALRYVGAPFVVTADPERLRTADRVIVPGVGDAAAAMDRLNSLCMSDALREFARSGRPFLGICLGSQIVLDRSQENNARCLGIVPGEAVAFDERPGRKVPHMGWNTLQPRRTHPLFAGIEPETSFYFVHSYVPRPDQERDCLAVTDYEETFCSVVGRDNVVATQFHPEKSGEPGLRMLQNFVEWNV
ncbi:MAG: imidazole glycerol phosphate synthase subunit HisH [Alkalispirochaeta sp.]